MPFIGIGNLIKIFDKHEEHYKLFTEIIGKLQPIAFLISVSLVLAVFFDNFDKDSISRKYALFASLSFFLAYLGFAFYKITNYRLSFYWGLSLTLISVILIYYSFGDVLAIILSIKNQRIITLAFYIIFSIFILITKFLLDKSNKNNLRYKISNTAFYIVVLLIIGYPIGIYLNLTIIPIFFIFLLLLLTTFISCINLQK